MDAVAQVRSFNRTVTERVGALQDSFLARGRPLGASRVLWEVGARQPMCARCGSGSISTPATSAGSCAGSRTTGLVEVGTGPRRPARPAHHADRGRPCRARGARHAQRRARRARCWLRSARPSGPQLVEAMQRVERLLTAGLVEVDRGEPGERRRAVLPAGVLRRARHALRRRFRSRRQRRRRPRRADRARRAAPRRAPAWRGDRQRRAALPRRRVGGDQAHVGRRQRPRPRRRAADPGRARGAARDRGVHVIRLETNQTLREAIGLYRSAGYAEIERFSPEPYAHHWFEKRI